MCLGAGGVKRSCGGIFESGVSLIGFAEEEHAVHPDCFNAGIGGGGDPEVAIGV